MSTERLPPVEIDAMKARFEESLEDGEALHRAYEAWLINWRIRMAEQHAMEAAE